jgi:hypothetical protein
MTLSREHPVGVISPLVRPPARHTYCPCVGFFGGEHDDAAIAHAAGRAHDATAHQPRLAQEKTFARASVTARYHLRQSGSSG